jgi:MFS family permease
MKAGYFAVLVGALGYFVDLFDIVIFNIYRVDSLKELGLNEQEVLAVGANILNAQLIGLLLGGLFFGFLGDRFGRKWSLFLTIFTYSLTTFLCGFVQNPWTYLLLRFICGFSLAGELGVAVTLVAEQFPPKSRGWAATILTAFGISGVIFASLVGKYIYWRYGYFLGGAMGFALLLLRLSVKESETFLKFKHVEKRGDIFSFFSSFERVKKMMIFIVFGAPVWIVVGVLMSFSYEISKSLNFGPVLVPIATLYTYIGATLGDFIWGAVSQLLKSRKKAIMISLVCIILLSVGLLVWPPTNEMTYLIFLFLLGASAANWVPIITTCAENVGTNFRALATTSLPNFIRASAVIFIEIFKQAVSAGASKLIVPVTSLICVAAIGLFLLRFIPETFGKELEFLE